MFSYRAQGQKSNSVGILLHGEGPPKSVVLCLQHFIMYQ